MALAHSPSVDTCRITPLPKGREVLIRRSRPMFYRIRVRPREDHRLKTTARGATKHQAILTPMI